MRRALPWHYTATVDEIYTVHPDGCRDVIWEQFATGHSRLRITGFDDQPRQAFLAAGTTLSAMRLQPGTIIAPELIRTPLRDQGDLAGLVDAETSLALETAEIIAALSKPGATLGHVARQAGTTPRSLQRRFRAQSLPRPDFWRLLGRARHAAQALCTPEALSEIALDAGFSDQAHMTREFHRWFGASPAAVRKDSMLRADICRTGLGTWA